MLRRIKKTLGTIRWAIYGWLYKSWPARILRNVSNPLWVARRSLNREILAHRHFATGRLLDIGCGGQPYRKLFSDVTQYVGIDMDTPYSKVNVYADGLSLPFADHTFDSLLCNQVLEHVNEPGLLFQEAHRVLRADGHIILTTPQVWGLHHEPYDFYRYTRYGLAHLAQTHGFEVATIAPTCGLWATLVQRMADTIVNDYAVKRSQITKRLIGLCLCPILLAGYALDRLCGKRGDTLDNVLIARKIKCQTARQSSPTKTFLSQAA